MASRLSAVMSEVQVVATARLAVETKGEGLVEITGTGVRILTDIAVDEAGIDEAHVQEALARAEARMKEQDLGPEEHPRVLVAEAGRVVELGQQLHVSRP